MADSQTETVWTSEEGIRVWIAESDEGQARALQEAVACDPRFDVVGVSASGRETLKAIEDLHPDILLLALALREVDGLYVLEQLGQSALLHYPRVAVITVMHALHGERALALGADLCMPKPVDTSRLLAWMREGRDQPAIARAGMGVRKTMSTRILEYLGMSPALNGFNYLVEAVALASVDHMITRHMMTELYPRVGHSFQTSVSCVERSIRRAIRRRGRAGR